jgi:hypothetical protein
MNAGGELFRPGTRAPITHDTVLVTEGRDMFGFSLALLHDLGLDQRIEVRNGGGLPSFHDYFQDLVNISGFASVISLGVMRDSETDPGGAFQSVNAGLLRANLPVPQVPFQSTASPPLPRVSVYLLPDPRTPGMLETLCWRALRGDQRVRCVEEYLDCLRKQTGKPLNHEEKSRIYSYIAGRERPSLLLGQAAHAGFFPWASPVFDEIKAFLRGLVGASP